MVCLLEFSLKKCDICIGILYVVYSGRAELRWGHSDIGRSLYIYNVGSKEYFDITEMYKSASYLQHYDF